jgi:hypothetical protein
MRVSPSVSFRIKKIVNYSAAVNKVIPAPAAAPGSSNRRNGDKIPPMRARVGQIDTTNGDRRAWR